VGGVLEIGATLRVFDITGRLRMEQIIQDNDQIIYIDLSGKPTGVYTLQMASVNYNVTRKFVIE
jgi:Secretion system C-terminal sorting domain